MFAISPGWFRKFANLRLLDINKIFIHGTQIPIDSFLLNNFQKIFSKWKFNIYFYNWKAELNNESKQGSTSFTRWCHMVSEKCTNKILLHSFFLLLLSRKSLLQLVMPNADWDNLFDCSFSGRNWYVHLIASKSILFF